MLNLRRVFTTIIALMVGLSCIGSQLAAKPVAQFPATPPHPFQPVLEFAFTIEIELEPAMFVGPSPTGAERAAVYIKRGTITGPMLQGRVIPMSGGDWAQKRPDGTLDFDARYMLELTDGTLVYRSRVHRDFHSGGQNSRVCSRRIGGCGAEASLGNTG